MFEKSILWVNNIQKKKNSIFCAITIAILLASSFLVFLPLTNAKSTDATIPTWAYLQVVPNPVGVGQTAYITMFLDKVPPTANGIGGDRWENFDLKVTKPDGTIQNMGPYTSDNVGGFSVVFVPDELGTYSFVFSFPGQTIAGANPNPPPTGFNPGSIGDVYGPSTSTTETLTVTNTPATSIPENPLPTGYWARPVEAFNHLWSTISGNWLGLGQVSFANSGDYSYNGNFNPYSPAVKSAHVVWTKPLAPGGQMGGEFGGSQETNYYTGFQYQPKFAPIILNGVLYYTLYPGASSNPQGWVAVDVRTGKTLWNKDTNDILLCGQVHNYKSINQYGGFAYLWATRGAGFLGAGSFLDMFDAFTGNLILTIANATTPSAFGSQFIEGSDGSLLLYFINSSFIGAYPPQLELWNSTQCILAGTPGYYLSTPQWGPPAGATIDYGPGVMWNAPVPTTYQGNPFPTVAGLFGPPGPASLAIQAIDTDKGVVIMTVAGGTSGAFQWQTGWQVEAGFSTKDGSLLWIKNQTQIPFTTVIMGPAGDGVYAEFTKETMTWTGYSTLDGTKLWGPTEPYSNPWGYYDQKSAMIAYGNLYTWTLGGQLFSYDLHTGTLKWSYSTGSSGVNTPYGVYPFWIIGNYEASIADHMIYVEVGHDYGPPLFPGARIYAINADNGTEMWTALNFATGSSLPIVDGYMLSHNAYDNQIYTYGKGLTATTVTATPGVGNTITVQGTVTDQSPGQTCLGIPAAGTPAISDGSMSAWMEYLYMQNPKPADAKGVFVTVIATDSNGNKATIGTVTSDIMGNYALSWTPPAQGIYKITTTFDGSNSYFASSGETSIAIGPSTSTNSVSTDTFYAITAALAILLVIILIVAIVLLVRKK